MFRGEKCVAINLTYVSLSISLSVIISTNMLFLYNVIHGNKRYGIPGVKNIGIKKFKKCF